MRHRVRLKLLAVFATALLRAAPAGDPYAPLWLYNGKWQITRGDSAPGAKPDALVNECARVGKFFACQQTVNGAVSALIIFISADKPGHYYTQSILPQGRATGRDELDIDGDRWTFSSGRLEGGKTTRYRTVNVFTGKTKIHYEHSESADGKEWKVTGSGDEVKTSGGK